MIQQSRLVQRIRLSNCNFEREVFVREAKTSPDLAPLTGISSSSQRLIVFYDAPAGRKSGYWSRSCPYCVRKRLERAHSDGHRYVCGGESRRCCSSHGVGSTKEAHRVRAGGNRNADGRRKGQSLQSRVGNAAAARCQSVTRPIDVGVVKEAACESGARAPSVRPGDQGLEKVVSRRKREIGNVGP